MNSHSEGQTLQINNIPPDKMNVLKEQASRTGTTPEQYALRLIMDALSPRKDPLDELLDHEYMSACAAEADPNVTLESVRRALSKIPGTMTDDFIAERDER